MKKKSYFMLLALLSLMQWGHFAAIAQTRIDDQFATTNPSWQGIGLSGTGSFQVSNGTMSVTSGSGSTYAAYHTQKLTGHFYVEVAIGQDDNSALALFKALPNGTPDPDNYSLIKVENVNGTPVVSINDSQNGTDNVLDLTGAANKNQRYQNVLDGNTYSVPYTGTNKRLRILRHANEKFLHFYYQVKKNVDGQDATGWIELAPSKEWNQLNGEFYMGLVAINGTATFDNAFAVNKPLNDLNDSNTGFKATWREMNWSGYFGDALVVTFDATEAPLTGGSRKFVFWESFNNVPAWYLDDEVMYTYEFVETWDGGSPGPHEPMSDRLRRFSKVTLDYDGPDYKLVHWEYVLLDPDYQWPDFGQGTEKPMVDEYYKIYPDGTILRKIRYKAKLDTQFRNWHELTELIVVTGNITDPSEHLEAPALTIWPINGTQQQYDPTGRGNDYEQSNNDATVLAVHMKNHPDLVNVFNDNPSYSDTYAGDPITFYKTWHDKYFHMSHWPINKEQYYSDPFKSQTTWKEQVKHTSLAGAGVYENNSAQWLTNFETDPADGREYREWISFMSLSPKNDLNQTKTNVQAWLPSPWDWAGPGTSPQPTTNVALNQPTVSSSVGSGNASSNAVDGNGNTRWESAHGSDQEWIYVDLGENHDISSMVINWESAYSSKYRIEVSQNASNWNTVYTDNNANGGTDQITLNAVSGRYVRVYGTDRATQWGHSLYEIEVYGVPASGSTTYTIQASAGANGSISPSGNTSVVSNGSQQYTISANSGYVISDVLVDNVSQGAIATYTFNNVTTSHTISAVFTSAQTPSFGRIEAEDYTAMSGIQTEQTQDIGGGLNVGWIGIGDWMEYEVNVPAAGAYTVDFRVASANQQIRLDLRQGNTVLTSVNSATTNGWQNWKTVSATVNLSAGIQTLRIEATGNSWNINWMEFTPVSTPACDVIYTGPQLSVNQETVNWTSGPIDISCATQAEISLSIEGVGPMENADYLNIYYRLDGGAQVAISENVNAFSARTITQGGLSGNSVELIVNGFTSWSNETYNVSNVVVRNQASTGGRQDFSEDITEGLPAVEPAIVLYPNPVSGNDLTLKIVNNENETARISIISMDGKVLSTMIADLHPGENTINVDVSLMQSGHYVVKTIRSDQTHMHRMTIMK